jgi:hypothetical protein
MKITLLSLLTSCLFLLGACSLFYDKPTSTTSVATPKPLVVPVSKHWQAMEAPPSLTNEQGRLPFQTEQSVQPEGTKTAPPVENRTIEISK